MSPVFCYDHIENVPVVYTGDWESGVTYTQGRDNEFFGATDKLIEGWEQMKEEFLQMYPRCPISHTTTKALYHAVQGFES